MALSPHLCVPIYAEDAPDEAAEAASRFPRFVMPTIVAGLGGVGRGQDRQALMESLEPWPRPGPEAPAHFINP